MYTQNDSYDYSILIRQATEIIDADPFFIPSLSNLSALLMNSLPDLNWAGFYLLRGNILVVGPFQGKPACVHIPEGKGVCGAALAEDRTLNVPDVHEFPGHIACDSASRSEIVIPLHRDGKPAGVLDIDSPEKGRFSASDEEGLTAFGKLLDKRIIWGNP